MNLDLSKLQERCRAPISAFHKEGAVSQTGNGVYIFKDNGASVLGVAHLDTVISKFSWRFKEKRQRVFCPMLDDRAGVWTLLDVLPTLGLKYDVLLTEGEETGRSTAKFFEPPAGKKYNWVFSFDRRGEDVVTYQYEDEPWKKTLREHGFSPSTGSNSDIRYLEDLLVKAMNIGTGYHGEHTQDCFLEIDELKRQIGRFQMFHTALGGTEFPHTKKVYSYQQTGLWDSKKHEKKQRILAYLRYRTRVTIVVHDREIICDLATLVKEMSPQEIQELFCDGVSEFTLPRAMVRTMEIQAYGNSRVPLVKDGEDGIQGYMDYYGI